MVLGRISGAGCESSEWLKESGQFILVTSQDLLVVCLKLGWKTPVNECVDDRKYHTVSYQVFTLKYAPDIFSRFGKQQVSVNNLLSMCIRKKAILYSNKGFAVS